MTKLWIVLAFIAGMSFQHSLVGEYARYGKHIFNEVEECEIYNKECDYIISPVSVVPIPEQLQMFQFSFYAFPLPRQRSGRDPNRDTMV